MKIGYTEFSFGYAFTENLIRSSATPPVGAPQFPNLIQEAQLGFDIKLNFPATPLFFQFKLPELMKRNSAFEITCGQCPGLTTPFFRIGLMRKDLSKQHALLIDLEKQYPAGVYYAAPALWTVAAFDQAYNAAKVAARSVFFSPRDIGPLPDNKQHNVAYDDALPVGFFCSQPRKVKTLSFEALSDIINHRLEAKAVPDIQQVASSVNEEILSLVPLSMRRAVGAIRDRTRSRRLNAEAATPIPPEIAEVEIELLVAREVARVGLGVDFVVAQPA
ncbi:MULTISPECIES: hypothetical protein [unclassified Mesorhizobium]|uniref:hypothetical protein n=1 Tax=unclassified Mesorhizobium TaxID=325217 RepID=UPI001CCBE525|nr:MULTISPECIES: hypothetical protein [unclassified Mesorhizobium]MBZ9679637.1 hypothetical protein [Mesorhizobium sp. CO1-1-2]MBZ9925011.1 hypothetical protein [Mesorhizobium sp. BR1-1-4]